MRQNAQRFLNQRRPKPSYYVPPLQRATDALAIPLAAHRGRPFPILPRRSSLPRLGSPMSASCSATFFSASVLSDPLCAFSGLASRSRPLRHAVTEHASTVDCVIGRGVTDSITSRNGSDLTLHGHHRPTCILAPPGIFTPVHHNQTMTSNLDVVHQILNTTQRIANAIIYCIFIA